jgi:hypothetical protein
MAKRYCPICKLNPLRRAEVNTCGAPDCVTTWKSLDAAQRAKAMAGESATIDLKFLRIRDDGTTPTVAEALEEQEHADAIGRGEGFLDSVFGDKKKEGGDK